MEAKTVKSNMTDMTQGSPAGLILFFALPLLVAAALVSIILASRTPQPIIEELPPEEADAPTALLTQTEEVGG